MPYKAFLSYRRSSDEPLAALLQTALPRIGRAPYQPSAFRVFRDRSNLSAAPGLWSSIQQALGDSEWFIYLASPEAAQSPWVRREIEWWFQQGRTRKFLIALTAGELVWDKERSAFDPERSTAMPALLLEQITEEPHWVDLRWTSREPKLTIRHPQFRDNTADLAAPLHGLTKDALLRDDVRVQRRTLFLARAGVAALVVALGVAIQQAVLARQRQQEAERQQTAAFARQLAVRAALARNEYPSYISRAVLLAIESLRRSYSLEAERVVREGTALLTRPERELRHDRPVYHVRFSPDDRYLAASGFTDSGASENTVLWDAAQGTIVRRFDGSGSGGMAFSADGAFMATASVRGPVSIWSLRDGRSIARVPHGKGSISVAFHPALPLLLSGGLDGVIRITEASTGAERMSLQLTGPITQVSFSPDGRRVAAGIDNGSATVFEWEGGPAFTPPPAGGRLRSIAFSGDSRYMALSSDDGLLRIFEADGREAYRFRGSRDSIMGTIAFQPSGRFVASSSDDRTVRIWDLEGGYEAPRLQHDHTVNRVTFSPDSLYLATASQDRTAVLWDAATWRRVLVLPHDHLVDDVAFSRDGKRIATAAFDGLVRIWPTSAGFVNRVFTASDLPPDIAVSPDGAGVLVVTQFAGSQFVDAATHEVRWTVDGHAARIGFSPEGTYAADAGEDGTVRIVRTNDGQVVSQFHVDDVPSQIAFSAQGKLFAVATENHTIEVWDVAARSRLQTIKATEYPQALAIDPSGTHVALATGNRNVWLWEIASGRSLTPLDTGCPAFDVAFDPAGALLATAASSNDCQSTRVWDWRSGRVVADLQYRNVPDITGNVHVLFFSPDSQRLIVATGDRSVRIFDVRSAQQLSHLTFPDYPAAAVLIDGGRSLRTVSQDGVVRTSTLDLKELLREGCARVARDLTPEEWREYLGEEPYHKTCGG